MIKELEKNLQAFKTGKFRLKVPILDGNAKMIRKEFFVDKSTLEQFKECLLKMIDGINYELDWDYSFMMSDDNKAFNTGYSQREEINKILNI